MLSPLAIAEFQELAAITREGSVPRLTRWVHLNSRRARRRERDVMQFLAAYAARLISDGSTFYRLEIDEATRPESVLVARMLTATLNGDDETLCALVDVWSTWEPNAREQALLELVREATEACHLDPDAWHTAEHP